MLFVVFYARNHCSHLQTLWVAIHYYAVDLADLIVYAYTPQWRLFAVHHAVTLALAATAYYAPPGTLAFFAKLFFHVETSNVGLCIWHALRAFDERALAR